MKTARLLVSAAAAALYLAACGGATTADGGGICHTTGQSCSTSLDCCDGFSCGNGSCVFTGGGNNGGGSGSGSSSGVTTGSSSKGTTGTSGGSSGSGSGSSSKTGSSSGSTTSSSHGTTGSSSSGNAGSSSGSSSSGNGSSSGGACAPYGTSCEAATCCAGLTCDAETALCYVSYGDPCPGEACADGYTCLSSSGVCGTPPACSLYGTFGCTASSCCTGLSCNSAADACYVAFGDPCAGEICASPYTCLSSGTCGTAPVGDGGLCSDPAIAACWLFEECAGTVAHDDSGNGNDGTLSDVGWATGSPGSPGCSVSFDGSPDSGVTVPTSASLNPTAALTVEAWIDPALVNTGGLWNRIVDKGVNTGYGLGLGNGSICFKVAGTFVCGTTTVSTSSWSHVAGTWDGATLTVYLNGSAAASTPLAGPLAATTLDLILGNHAEGPWGAPYAFEGEMDLVRVYSRAKSAAEICADAAGSWNGSTCS